MRGSKIEACQQKIFGMIEVLDLERRRTLSIFRVLILPTFLQSEQFTKLAAAGTE